MKIKSIILTLTIGLAVACQPEEFGLNEKTAIAELLPAPSATSLTNLSSIASMPGMISEVHVNEAGEGQCLVATSSEKMVSYNREMQDALASNDKTISKASASIQNSNANLNVFYLGFSPEAQIAFQSAVDTWSALLSSDVDINVLARYAPLGPGVLGSAGSTYIVRDVPGMQRETWYGMALADKLAGEDIIPGQFDIVATFSSAFPNWYFGTDGNTPSDQYDFRSVVLHELCHGLGFFGSASVNPAGVGSLGFGTPFPVIYDRFAVTRLGRQLTKENKFPNPSPLLGEAFTGDQILFTGENVIVATKGDRAKLFTYPIWLQGSSYSHLDEFTYLAGSENALMTPAIGRGESYAEPGPIVLAIFDDIGWNGKIKKPTK